MSKFNDETVNPIILGIALDNDIGVDKVREVLDEYYKGVTGLIESGVPHQIKLDYLGKIKAKSTFVQIEEKIVKKFGNLVGRNNEPIQA